MIVIKQQQTYDSEHEKHSTTSLGERERNKKIPANNPGRQHWTLNFAKNKSKYGHMLRNLVTPTKCLYLSLCLCACQYGDERGQSEVAVLPEEAGPERATQRETEGPEEAG